jgi:hypothetical protein
VSWKISSAVAALCNEKKKQHMMTFSDAAVHPSKNTGIWGLILVECAETLIFTSMITYF